MPVDVGLLQRHARYEDLQAGISEEFLTPALGGGTTIAVLSRPLREPSPIGWVICHSLGMEQIHLGRLDVIAARALSKAGFSVLRFHGGGYGDSNATLDAIGLSSHLADATDAVRLMGKQEGIEQVGIIGARFGGTVAALVADRMDLPLMVLWEPIARGAAYMRDFLRSQVLSLIVGEGGEGGTSAVDRIRAELSSKGWSDIKGFRLSREAHEQIGAIDLMRDIKTFAGSSLLIGVSRTDRTNPALAKLAEHLRGIGGTCTLDVLQDPFAVQFGHFRYQTVNGGRGKRDVQLELNEKIAAATVAWSLELQTRQTTTEVGR